MICTKCNSDGVLNHANGKPFYYCKVCKTEIEATQDPNNQPLCPMEDDDITGDIDFDKELDDWFFDILKGIP